MVDLINFSLVKHTGKSGYPVDVGCVGFKSIDSATSNENDDVKNYPVYAPYLRPRSFSYENWMKIKLNLNTNVDYVLSSRGLTIKEECNKFCYNVTYTKIKNISIWFDAQPLDNTHIRVGQSVDYRRPINTLSDIAVEDVLTYFNDTGEFNDLIKIPLYFNGKNELLVNQIDNAIDDNYIIFQLEVLKGLTYQLDYRPLKFRLHYEVE